MTTKLFNQFRKTCQDNNYDNSVMCAGYMFINMTEKQIKTIKYDLLERGLGNLDENGALHYTWYVFK